MHAPIWPNVTKLCASRGHRQSSQQRPTRMKTSLNLLSRRSPLFSATQQPPEQTADGHRYRTWSQTAIEQEPTHDADSDSITDHETSPVNQIESPLSSKWPIYITRHFANPDQNWATPAANWNIQAKSMQLGPLMVELKSEPFKTELSPLKLQLIWANTNKQTHIKMSFCSYILLVSITRLSSNWHPYLSRTILPLTRKPWVWHLHVSELIFIFWVLLLFLKRYIELQNGIIQLHIITMPLFLFAFFFILFIHSTFCTIYYTTCWLEIALEVLNCVLHHYIHILILKSRHGFQISIQHSYGIIWWRLKYVQYVDRKSLITCILWYVTYAVFLCIEIAHYLQGLNTMTILMLEPQTGPAKMCWIRISIQSYHWWWCISWLFTWVFLWPYSICLRICPD